MGLIPEKKEYKNFTYDNYLLYTEKIEDKLGFQQIIHTPFNAKNHFDRFGYLDKGKKVVVVYDVKAQMMSVTAHDSSMKALEQIAKDFTGAKTDKKADKKQETNDKKVETVDVKSAIKKTEKQKKNDLNNEKTPKTKAGDKIQNKAKEALQKSKGQQNKDKIKSQENQPNKKEKKGSLQKSQEKKKDIEQKNNSQNKEKSKKQNEPKAKVETTEKAVSTRCIIEQYYPLSFNNAMQNLRNIDGVVINTLKTLSRASDNETVRYAISKNGLSGEIEYMTKKGTLTIDGSVANEIKNVFLELGGKETQSNAQKVKQSSNNNEDMLKKACPSAVKMLSSNQKSDLAESLSALDKEGNQKDYSTLVNLSIKSLETFISDLLNSEKIQANQIGQVYDKRKDGSYELRACYQKRCKIVYCEVLNALYNKFYSLRLQCTDKRKVSKKTDAQSVINEVVALFEYNCKKLEEINYTVKR